MKIIVLYQLVVLNLYNIYHVGGICNVGDEFASNTLCSSTEITITIKQLKSKCSQFARLYDVTGCNGSAKVIVLCDQPSLLCSPQ